jgi:hypothetical protein
MFEKLVARTKQISVLHIDVAIMKICWLKYSVAISSLLPFFCFNFMHYLNSKHLSFPAQDHINDWRKTSICLTSIFFLAAGVWFIGKRHAAF